MNLIQAREMVKLQDAMNARVNPAWQRAGNNWLRAVMVEGVEAVEHHGWKWWKHQTMDLPQVRMELVDIWHFLLSKTIEHFHGDLEMAAGAVTHESQDQFLNDGLTFDGKFYNFIQMSLLQKLELMVGLAAAGRMSIPLFFSAALDTNMDGDMLYRMYVGKNVLNFFRQEHGYKEGTYVKMWEGREDNEWLVELADALDPNDPSFAARLNNLLGVKYEQVINPDAD